MPYSIPGAKVLLCGPSGTGKTHSIRTLLPRVTPFILFTENGMRTLGDLTDEQCHWKYIPSALPSFADLQASIETINRSFDFEALSKQKNWQKQGYQQFIQAAISMNDFECDRCGRSFGSVDSWGTDRALVVDSLTGLSRMAMDNTVGAKPVKAPGDWGTAMDNLERFIIRLTGGLQCHFILTAHLEREVDQISGAIKLMASTLGQKLAPKLPALFDDVVETQHPTKDSFIWRTWAPNVDLKARNLPMSDNLVPSFGPLLDSWAKAGGVFQPKEEKAA